MQGQGLKGAIFAVQFGQAELNRLIAGQGPGEGVALARVSHALLDTVTRGAQAGGGLAYAVFVHEVLGHGQTPVLFTEHRIGGQPHLAQAHPGVIGGHVEGPQPFLDVHARRVTGHHETGDAGSGARLAAGAGKDQDMRGEVRAGGPHLFAVDQPPGLAVALAGLGAGGQPGGVRAVFRFGQPEGHRNAAVDTAGDKRLALPRRAEVAKGQGGGEVAHDAVLVLQIAVQTDAARREMLADHRHFEVAGIAAPEL